jgi:hypothetical protein
VSPPAVPLTVLDLEPKVRSLGDGIEVRRLLPSARRRMVGPFIFVDHIGPLALAPDHGLDVRPHPHINLATVTYLFEGEFLHRDSLGSEQIIQPGAVNWMTAGSGIAHSERSPAAARRAGARMHGLQLWVALPSAVEEQAPSFQHHPARTIPEVEGPGARLRVIAGAAYGVRAPVEVASPLCYVEARLEAGATLALPEAYAERAAYVVDGAIELAGATRAAGRFAFVDGEDVVVRALASTHLMILGGDPLDGERHIWWNFVSSSPERIARAREAWAAGGFAPVPGDEDERIPLPT